MSLFNKRLLNRQIQKHIHAFSTEKKQELKILFKQTLERIETKKFKKEESEKVPFLQKMFELLGYKLHENLEFEFSTQGRSIDGVLGEQIENSRKAEVAIEWKGTNTKSLDKGKAGETPVSQMWDYMGKTNTNFGIVGNFLEWRLYTKQKGQTEYHQFNLRELATQEDKLDEMIFLLKKSILLRGNSKTSGLEDLLHQSEVEQAEITKRFYNDYKDLRDRLFEHLIQNNSDTSRHLLLEKTQKILDRMIFVMFCEDGYLISSNTVKNTYDQARNTILPTPTKIWDFFKGLFLAIDKGNDYPKINAFNGGLFADDPELNNLIIKDEIWQDLVKLAEYDFGSDLDVNILGHIFEQSIADIEEIKAELEGETTDKKKSKRKKEGIYYTPSYITEYIVNETVGNYLKNNHDKLETIKIIDPAGGSGAFLNQVHNYLVKKTVEVQTQQAIADGFENFIPDERTIDKSILNNNIFMVDLQPESVEIAKLSLWLKTARKDQKLNNLDENVKVGNSLIDDPEIAGDKAFDWNTEFEEVMKSGGFDVVVGNPPYGAKLSKEDQEYLLKSYQAGSTETVILFIKKSLSLLKNCGYLGFIIPKSFCFASNYAKLREEIWDNVVEIVDCGKVWKEVKLEQIILIVQKGAKHDFYINKTRNGENFENASKIDKKIAKEFGFFLNGVSEKDILKAKKMLENSVMLNDIAENVPGVPNQKYIGQGNPNYEMIGGAEFDRYLFKGIKGLIDKKWVEGFNGAFVVENSILVQNIIAHIENPEPHIKIIACIPSKEKVGKLALANTINQIIIKSEFLEKYNNYYLWAVLNSNICNWYMYNFALGRGIRTLHFYSPVSSQLPIPKATPQQQTQIAGLVDRIMELKKKQKLQLDKTWQTLEREYAPKNLSKKLQDFWKMGFVDFVDELQKQKVKLTLTQKEDLQEYFEQNKQKIIEMEKEIGQIDQQIEELVRGLYGFNLL